MKRMTKNYVVTLFVGTDTANTFEVLRKNRLTGPKCSMNEWGEIQWEYATKRAQQKKETELKQYLRTKTWNRRKQFDLNVFED
jgi:hypothetical protein